MALDLASLQQRLAEFATARDWGAFHTPKNLTLALVGEVGELAAELQWLSEQEIGELLQDHEHSKPLASELADVFIYLVRLADVCGVDLLAAANAKVEANELRYPVALARGNARKYTSLNAKG